MMDRENSPTTLSTLRAGSVGITGGGWPVPSYEPVASHLPPEIVDSDRHRCGLGGTARLPAVPVAHARKFATRAAWKAISDCMQVTGARGFRADDGHPMTRHLACARMAQWLDGATEIQNVVIARSLMRDRQASP